VTAVISHRGDYNYFALSLFGLGVEAPGSDAQNATADAMVGTSESSTFSASRQAALVHGTGSENTP